MLEDHCACTVAHIARMLAGFRSRSLNRTTAPLARAMPPWLGKKTPTLEMKEARSEVAISARHDEASFSE